MGAYGHSHSVTRHAFFMLCMYGGHPHIIQTYRWCPNIWGHPDIQGVAKHIGSIQTWGHSNIQGVSTHGGIQTYMRPSKHMGHPNVWSIWTPLSVTKHAFFVLCMYRGHPNTFQTYGASKHMGVSTHIHEASKNRGARYVWISPVHTQHKESMLCQTKGCPYAQYIWMPP